MYLQCFIRAFNGRFTGIPFGHGDQTVVDRSLVNQPCCLIVKVPGRPDPGRHLCQFELNGLEGCQWNPKLMPLFGIFYPFFQGCPGNTHTLGTYMEAGSVEKGHEFLEPFPLFSYEVCKGNP